MTNNLEDTVDSVEDRALDETHSNATSDRKENRDSISGELGAHPVGVGVGAAMAGAAAGAVAGAVAGPVASMIGTLVGGIAGGMAGKEIAEQMNPTQLAEYWQSEYPKTDYFDEMVSYADYDAAYRFGYQARFRFAGASWDSIRAQLESEWSAFSLGQSKLSWSEAEHAAKDGFERSYSRGCGNECATA